MRIRAKKAAAKLPMETMAAIVLFLVILYILAGPYLFGWVKGTIEKWTEPQREESNSISLALCEYRQGRTEYPFEWLSKDAGDLKDVAKGLLDCEWMKELKIAHIDVSLLPASAPCPTTENAGVTAYLLEEPGVSAPDQYQFSQGKTYKAIAERIGDVEVPDVCMCVTADLQRHSCR